MFACGRILLFVLLLLQVIVAKEMWPGCCSSRPDDFFNCLGPSSGCRAVTRSLRSLPDSSIYRGCLLLHLQNWKPNKQKITYYDNQTWPKSSNNTYFKLFCVETNHVLERILSSRSTTPDGLTPGLTDLWSWKTLTGCNLLHGRTTIVMENVFSLSPITLIPVASANYATPNE